MSAEILDEDDQTPITGKILSSPITPRDLNDVPGVSYIHTPFFLTEAEFIYLQGRSSITTEISIILFSAWIGFALGLIPKLLEMLKTGENTLSAYEFFSLGGILAVNAFLYVIGYFFPSEKTKLMKKIKRHFKNHRPVMGEE